MTQSIKNTQSISNRIEWIDSAKGLGIILVVLGHTWDIPNWLYCGIYAFHMPLFFMLSGLTCKFEKQVSAKEYLLKLWKAYIIPYFLLAGINLVLQSLWMLYLGELTWQTVIKYLGGILYCYANTTWMPNCSPIWFLPGIFLAKLFVFYAYRLARGNRLLSTAIVGILGLIALTTDWLDVPRMPWNVLPAMMGSVFLWGGYCLRSDAAFMQKGWNRFTVVLSVVAIALTPWIIGNVPGMNENYYDNALLFIISGFGYSFVFIQIANRLKNVSYTASFLGKGSLIIMGFNYFARTFAIEFYYLIPIVRNYPIRPLICFCMTMAVLSVILYLYNYFRNCRGGRKICEAV